MTESSHIAGEAYQLNENELAALTEYVKEMDTIDVVQLDANSF